VRFSKVRIAALGHEVPPATLTSLDIEARLAPVYERLKLHPGRLELMTGIQARRYWPEPVTPSLVAARAGRQALLRSGVPAEALGCVVHASVCRDFLEPATANVVHDALGLPRSCQVLDVSNACLGVLNGMLLVANQLELGQIKAGLVVAGENGKPLVDATIASLLADPTVTRKSIKSAFASLTIGSGAAAVLLCHPDLAPEAPAFEAVAVRAATEHHRLCQGGAAAEGHAPMDAGVGAGTALSMSTDAEALLHAGVALAKETWAELGRESSFSPATPPDRVVTHQVGKAHHLGLFAALELDPSTAYTTFEGLGNMGSVSWPLTLAQAVEAGFVARGHRVAILGIGSGLSCMMAEVRW
jgi:3-oxoacyl-[acyl-carrier-protein] synthase III